MTNAIQTNIITAYETHHEEIINTPFYPYESFHVYAFEWTPVSIKFFIDDELVRQDYNDYVSTHNTGQKIMMNIWQPIWENWVGAFDETILPVYAYYDWVKYYSYTPGEGTYGSFNNFSFSWEDNFDFFNNQIWQKATHSWSANNAQFVQQNAVLQDGYLILCLTDNLSYGYSGGELSVLESSSEEKAIFQISPNPFNSYLRKGMLKLCRVYPASNEYGFRCLFSKKQVDPDSTSNQGPFRTLSRRPPSDSGMKHL